LHPDQIKKAKDLVYIIPIFRFFVNNFLSNFIQIFTQSEKGKNRGVFCDLKKTIPGMGVRPEKILSYYLFIAMR